MTASGLVIVDKPGGMTSHDVVARARRGLGTRKVGHAGTLDPMATGVLILGVERATRLLGHLSLRDKAYDATVRLGARTVTDDAEGDVVETADAAVLHALDEADIADAFTRQTGTLQQRPSAVSAVKVGGRRAYERVRAGEDVDLAPRTVVISRIDVHEVRWGPDAVDIDISVDCSTGTFIRAIARDVGEQLGVGGHLSALRRTRVGPFTLADAVALEDLAAPACIRPLDEVAPRCFPVWPLATAEEADAVRHGRRIPWTGSAGSPGPVAVVGPGGEFLALAEDDGGLARYVAVFG